ARRRLSSCTMRVSDPIVSGIAGRRLSSWARIATRGGIGMADCNAHAGGSGPARVDFPDAGAPGRGASVRAAELRVVPGRDPLRPDADHDPLRGLAAHRIPQALRGTRRVVFAVHALEHVEHALGVLLEGRAAADE